MTSASEPTRANYDVLSGYTVIDLTQYLSGPISTLILAYLGARVVKVEPPRVGDGNRHQPPFVAQGKVAQLSGARMDSDEAGLAFLKRNANKESIELDLKSATDYEKFAELVTTADVVVHNFRGGVAERLRVSKDVLTEINPSLVYCAISGSGTYGADDGSQGMVDVVGQAVSGIMGATGQAGGPPTKCAAPIADQSAGLYATIGILSALLSRDGLRGDGESRSLDVSMVGALSTLLWDEHLDVYEQAGLPRRNGNSTPRITPFDTYLCQDSKFVAISGVSEAEWKRLKSAIDDTRLDNPKWDSLAGRVADTAAIDGLIAEWTAKRTRSEAVAILKRFGCTSGPVYEIDDILSDKDFIDTFLAPVRDHDDKETDALGARFPIVVNGQRLSRLGRGAPRLGGRLGNAS